MAIVDADMMMTAPKGLTSASRYRRRDPRPGGLRLHDGHRLHRRPGPARPCKQHFRVPAPRLRRTAPTIPRPERRWPTPPPWPAWPSPTPSWACATPWRTSWAPSITCPTAWPTPCIIDEVLRFNAAEVPAKMGTFPQYDHPHTLRRYAEIADFLGLKRQERPGEAGKPDCRGALTTSRSRSASRTPSGTYGIEEKNFLDTPGRNGGAGLRRPVHRRQSPLSPDERNQTDVPERLLRQSKEEA